MFKFTIVTINKRPDLLTGVKEVTRTTWPQFMLHDSIGNLYWSDLYQTFPQFQFACIDGNTERVIAVGNSLPLAWESEFQNLPDDGWDWALAQGFKDHASDQTAKVLCALSVAIANPFRGKGISGQMVATMQSIAKANGLASVIAPVRPSLKSRYPLSYGALHPMAR